LNILNIYSPLLENIISSVLGFILGSIILYLIVLTAEKLTNNWNTRKIIGVIYFIVIGFVIMGTGGIESLYGFLFGGLAAGIAFIIFYLFLFRYNTSVIPFIVLGLMIFNNLKEGFLNGYTNSFLYSLIAIIAVAVFAYYTTKKLIFTD